MKNTISLFMWGYQPHFRAFMRSRARDVLRLIGAESEPKALLVGIRTPEKSDGHDACVEPEDGEWDPRIFFPCAARAADIYAAHPGHSILYGDEPRTRDQPENIRRDSVRQAVKETLAKYDSSLGSVSFCGTATRVAGHHVVPILQFDYRETAEYARLPREIRLDDCVASAGLFESTVYRLLQEASDALAGKEPGRFFDTFHLDANGIVRDAGSHFCNAITLATHDMSLQDVFDALNNISALRYEGSGAVGELLFAPADSDGYLRSHRLIPPGTSWANWPRR
jgi:hypothetical protein